MADHNDVRRIALALPQTSEASGHFGFSVANKGKHKQFVWTWNERDEPAASPPCSCGSSSSTSKSWKS